ncbi:DUF4833 domain-containing protein [Sphingobacterium suaedae]|uniref:DUF4833 domain-containing protein n=1 Tax=Sphingobacterium suaedae TaxID=1686402 RepID=A0ABW5KP09_9SPHI
MRRRLILLLLTIVSCGLAYAQEGYPMPKVKHLLFYIQHNRGHNTFLYQLHMNADGRVIREAPIKVTRQLFDEGGEIKPLTDLQRRFAYGVKINAGRGGDYIFTIAAYPKLKFLLKMKDSTHGAVYTHIHRKRMEVKRLFLVQREGTSGLGTKLDYILFYGMDIQGENVVEKLIP